MNFNAVKNVRWADADHTSVAMDVDFDFLQDDWVPFVATPDYDQEYGRILYASAVAGEFGTIGEFVPPVIPKVVPEKVSRFQARAALYQANLLDDIEAYMALETTDFFTKLAWTEATEFNRTSPMVASIGTLLGLTESQLDDLFVFAATIKA